MDGRRRRRPRHRRPEPDRRDRRRRRAAARARLRALPAGARRARRAPPIASLADLGGLPHRDVVSAHGRGAARARRRRRAASSRSAARSSWLRGCTPPTPIVDLVSSGDTLRQNGLVELETLLESQAVLIARRDLSAQQRALTEELRLLIDSVLAARPKRYVMLNARDESLAEVLALLPGLDAPTVLPLARGDMHAVHAVVDAGRGRPAARAAARGGRVLDPRPPHRAPDRMSLDDLRTRIRPELARSSPYRWQEGIPDGPVDRFDMNTPADAPGLVRRRRSRAWPRSRPTTTPTRRTCRSSARSPRYAGVDAGPGRRRGRLRRGAGAVRAARARARRPRARREADLPALRRRQPQRRRRGARARAAATGSRSAREELVREAAGVRLVWLCSPNNPTGEELDAALVERICAACPGIVVLDQAYLELGGEDFSPLVARPREPRRHAHVLEGLRARRRARRLRPRAAARWPRRSTRCARPARSRRGRPRVGRDRLSRARGDARRAAPRSSRSAAGWRPACARAGVEVLAQRRQLRARPRARARRVRRGSSSAGCAVRTFAHEPLLADCFRVDRRRTADANDAPAARARRARRRRGAGAPSDGVRGERVGASVRARHARDEHRRARSACSAAAARASRPASASSTTCSRASRSGRSPTSSCAATATSGSTSTTRSRTARIALGEALRRRARRPRRACAASAPPARRSTRRSPRPPSTSRAAASPSSTSRFARAGDRAHADDARAALLRQLRARAAALGLHLSARGEDAHHVAEAAFKALALALREAVEPDPAPRRHREHEGRAVTATCRRLRRGQPALAARRVRAHRRARSPSATEPERGRRARPSW